ncbi:POK9 protein, partial [Nesospiza acunhae]|nr:POK9 protein [Nesospiza acunhae]
SLPAPIRKRQAQHKKHQQPPRQDTSSSCQHISTTSLRPATAGSLGLDLGASVTVTLIITQPQKVPTKGVKGPIVIKGQSVGALLLGRSSASMLGLFVLPGVIDKDYTGEICVMVHTPFPPVKIDKGQRIAQLVPLPQLTEGMLPLQQNIRGEHGFGSTGGLTLLTLDLSTRPKHTVKLEYNGEQKNLEGLLTTGADSSIMSPEYWPPGWPLQNSMVTVTGVGGLTLAKKSPALSVTIEGQTLRCVLSVVPLPNTVQCLIGRDILAQMGMVL